MFWLLVCIIYFVICWKQNVSSPCQLGHCHGEFCAHSHLVYLLINCPDLHQVSSLVNAVDSSAQLHTVTQLSRHRLTDLIGTSGKLALLSYWTAENSFPDFG